MSSVSSIRLPGLATGMDTEAMVKAMLTNEQNKIDKAQQKQQTITWQQEIYREIIGDVKELNDKYFSITSKDSIINSSAWNTLSINSSDASIITASGSAGANVINYKFTVDKLAMVGNASTDTEINGIKIKKDSSLKELGLHKDESDNDTQVTEFFIRYGDGEKEVTDKISIRTKETYKTQTVLKQEKNENGTPKVDENGNPVYVQAKNEDGTLKIDENGNPVYETEEIQVIDEPADTVATLIDKINKASGGNIKASYSEMSGKFMIEGKNTGADNGFTIVGADKKTTSDALSFLKLKGSNSEGKFVGTNCKVKVSLPDGTVVNDNLENSKNSFTIDGIKYDIHSIGTSDLTSKQDYQAVLDNMNAFVEDYNKIMDKIYDLVTQKANIDYQPLTEAQKEEMSEDEIEKWEKKAKVGILRNDSEMRKFMDDMQQAIFGDKMEILNEMGLTSHSDYNKKGQVALNEEKFIKALENNSEKVYETFAKDSTSVLERMKSTINKYVGGSSSTFAKKAGLEKTASAVKNFYSEQLKKQADIIKTLQNKFNDRETALYKKFGALESSMNKLNSQMNYFMQA